MNNTAKLKSIDSVYASIPAFTCKEGCCDCCGPILMTRLEALRIHRATGTNPLAMLLDIKKHIENDNLRCPYVDPATHRCSIYEIRPAVCRVFGSSEHPRLTCPNGCRPEWLLTKAETSAVMNQVDKLGY